MDQSVRQPEDLARITGYPVLAVIPYLETANDRSRNRFRRLVLAGGSLGMISISLMAVHFLYRPLDILWIKILRRLYISF